MISPEIELCEKEIQLSRQNNFLCSLVFANLSPETIEYYQKKGFLIQVTKTTVPDSNLFVEVNHGASNS